MKTILALFVGTLFGLAAADLWEASKGVEAPMTREAIYARHMPMADERVKRDDETCLYTSLNGRPAGVAYTVVIPAGVRCLTIVGEQR